MHGVCVPFSLSGLSHTRKWQPFSIICLYSTFGLQYHRLLLLLLQVQLHNLNFSISPWVAYENSDEAHFLLASLPHPAPSSQVINDHPPRVFTAGLGSHFCFLYFCYLLLRDHTPDQPPHQWMHFVSITITHTGQSCEHQKESARCCLCIRQSHACVFCCCNGCFPHFPLCGVWCSFFFFLTTTLVTPLHPFFGGAQEQKYHVHHAESYIFLPSSFLEGIVEYSLVQNLHALVFTNA